MNDKPSEHSFFQIANVDCPIDFTRTNWYIDKNSHTLVTEIYIQFPDKRLAKKLLDDYNEDAEVKIYFEAEKIFQRGVPTGEFIYEADKHAASYSYFRKEGLAYSLDFFGIVRYDKGRVYISGEFRPSYDAKPIFQVSATLLLDTQVLDWTQYRFKSLQEAKQADSNKVQHLQLENPAFTNLPDEVYDFRNLKHLSILNRSNYWDNVKLPLKHLDERVKQWSSLEGLQITGASLRQLPTELGQLDQLQSLNFTFCDLEEIPANVWKLPNLNFLFVDRNNITYIPEDVDLPALRSLGLQHNKLNTLPQALVALPNVSRIEAEDNPFELLPDAFNTFNGLQLTLEEKKRLLDNSYKGADGLGLVGWDDAAYRLTEESVLAPIQQIIQSENLETYQDALLSLVKKALGFQQVAIEDYQTVGNHRFGGRPDLPMDIPYPTFFDDTHGRTYHYEFLAQINCEQLAGQQDYLPPTGSLFFFFKTIHYFGFGNDHIGKVIYVEKNAQLASGQRFTLEEEDFFELMNGGYTGRKASVSDIASVPSFYARYQNSYLFQGAASELKDEDELLENLYDSFEEPVRALSTFDHAVNSYAFTQHESPELQAALRKKGNPEDWIILLLLSSSGDFQWGDAGELFFVIHKSDLAKKDFSNVVVTLESS